MKMSSVVFKVLAAAAVLFFFGSSVENPNDWENPAVFAVNKCDPRASFFVFTDSFNTDMVTMI